MELDSQTTVRASHWGITVNNPIEDDFVRIRTEQRWLRMVKFQQERGENGTPHIQGYANTDQVRLSQIKQWLPRAHFKVLLSKEHIENTKAYVNKDDTAIEGTREEYNYREGGPKPITMAGALTRMAEYAWSEGRVKLWMDNEGGKPKKLKEVYEDEYWYIVKVLLNEDPDLVGLYTQPQYLRAWINTRSVWTLKYSVDSQTRLRVVTPDGEISPVSV